MMRVFIADDEEIIRDGIRNCIEKEQERFLFAGEAPDGEMALKRHKKTPVKIFLTGVQSVNKVRFRDVDVAARQRA